jgi:hypothetical protein
MVKHHGNHHQFAFIKTKTNSLLMLTTVTFMSLFQYRASQSPAKVVLMKQCYVASLILCFAFHQNTEQ